MFTHTTATCQNFSVIVRQSMAAIILGLSVACSNSSVIAAETPRYQDRIAIFDLRTDFTNVSKYLGFLVATKLLSPEHARDVQELAAEVDQIKKKYRSEYTDAAWASNQDSFDQGVSDAARIDSKVAASNPYACTRFSNVGGVQEGHSDYVDRVDIDLRGLRLSVYRLKNLLPNPASSGLLMLTAADYDRIEGPQILCVSNKGTMPSLQTSSTGSSQSQQKTRVAPYSSDRKPQHEMMCAQLDDPRIPPPAPLMNGATCVYNYK